jgi:hypothetical protein
MSSCKGKQKCVIHPWRKEEVVSKHKERKNNKMLWELYEHFHFMTKKHIYPKPFSRSSIHSIGFISLQETQLLPCMASFAVYFFTRSMAVDCFPCAFLRYTRKIKSTWYKPETHTANKTCMAIYLEYTRQKNDVWQTFRNRHDKRKHTAKCSSGTWQTERWQHTGEPHGTTGYCKRHRDILPGLPCILS